MASPKTSWTSADSGSAADPRPLVVCASPMGPPWRWFEADTAERIRWRFFDSEPRGWLTRHVRKPNLASSLCAARAVAAVRAGRARLLITHDPRIAARCALLTRPIGARAPHVAWSFNYAYLP